MKNFLMLLLVFVALSFIGCASQPVVNTQALENSGYVDSLNAYNELLKPDVKQLYLTYAGDSVVSTMPLSSQVNVFAHIGYGKAVNISTAQAKANDDAMANIARQLESRIQILTKNMATTFEKQGIDEAQIDENHNYKSETELLVNKTLRTVKFLKYYEKKDGKYINTAVLAVLNINNDKFVDEYANSLKNLINKKMADKEQKELSAEMKTEIKNIMLEKKEALGITE